MDQDLKNQINTPWGMLSKQLPPILTPADVAVYLKVSRNRVYDLMNLHPDHGGIPSFTVGAGKKRPSRRVAREDFEKWLEAKKGSASHESRVAT